MTAPFPQPQRTRWQPLRLGLIEFFYYDREEFWFADGHLLLRGNNGTGKSKLLSLTLPFLLDANLAASRVEPDGDRSKRMEWNLLVGKHEQRTGYAWIEFGRLDQTGEAKFLTLGCGIKAVKDRPRSDHWFFYSAQRIGENLHLISDSRVVLNREALTQALGTQGRIAASAQDYRRAVDEQLFGLGETRYGALMDTLIQLRQPQLSKNPDEARLSAALSNALPPLPQNLLDDVAEAMNQLDQYREELQGIEQLRDAVSKFNRVYGRYAQVLARRQARVLRQAQTTYDNASQAVNAATSEERTARSLAETAAREAGESESALNRDRTQLSALREDPQARGYANAKKADSDAESAQTSARRRLDQSSGELKLERDGTLHRSSACTESAARHGEQAAKLSLPATAAGLGDLPASWLTADATTEILRWQPAQQATRRREQVQQLRRRLKEIEAAAKTRDQMRTLSEAAREAENHAQDSLLEKSRKVESTSVALRQAWRHWLDAAVELRLTEPEATLAALDEWLEMQDGINPAHQAMQSAQDAQRATVLAARAELAQRIDTLGAQDQTLAEEQATLADGRPPEPLLAPTRDAISRTGRAGAPLWQLIEFRPEVADAARAGLEAALQACGLLDAWLNPDGRLLHPETMDAVLLPRSSRPHSLLSCIEAAAETAVPAELIASVLASIDLSPQDEGAEAWVSVDGRYRLGPLSGRWQKPSAEFIGHAAREAARQKRLFEIANLRAGLAEQIGVVQQDQLSLESRQSAALAEAHAVPADEALRNAHAARHAASDGLRQAQERHAEKAAAYQQAEHAWQSARTKLSEDARDLNLPPAEDGLHIVEQALMQFEQSVQSLRHLLETLHAANRELRDQQEREAKAVDAHADFASEWQQRKRAADEARERYTALHQAIGSTVETIQQRIVELSDAVENGAVALPGKREAQTRATQAHGAAQQKLKDDTERMGEDEKARRAAAETLQRFVETELLSVAAPELETPAHWTLDAALQLARRAEQALGNVDDSDASWTRVQKDISNDYTELGRALIAQNEQAQMEQNDFGLTVRVFHANRPERPDVLEQRLTAEALQRREILSSQERAVLENHLQSHIAVDLQSLMKQANAHSKRINEELEKRPTSTGVRFKLTWEALPETQDGVAGFAGLRDTLLLKTADAWSPAERNAIGTFLQARIQSQRSLDEGGKLADHLAAALDYRNWHRYRVSRLQGVDWKPLAGPASSGEKALGLTVPLFAAASGHYASCQSPHAPRLVLLDEAFAGIDREARSHCMGLIRAFDLDFVMTSEHEWGCHATLPGVAIAQLQRLPNVDAVHVSRWRWDGLRKLADSDPPRLW